MVQEMQILACECACRCENKIDKTAILINEIGFYIMLSFAVFLATWFAIAVLLWEMIGTHIANYEKEHKDTVLGKFIRVFFSICPDFKMGKDEKD